VISGEADPVGKYGQGIRQFVGQMKNHNINNIDLKLYPEAGMNCSMKSTGMK